MAKKRAKKQRSKAAGRGRKPRTCPRRRLVRRPARHKGTLGPLVQIIAVTLISIVAILTGTGNLPAVLHSVQQVFAVRK